MRQLFDKNINSLLPVDEFTEDYSYESNVYIKNKNEVREDFYNEINIDGICNEASKLMKNGDAFVVTCNLRGLKAILKIRFRNKTLETFIDRSYINVSGGKNAFIYYVQKKINMLIDANESLNNIFYELDF